MQTIKYSSLYSKGKVPSNEFGESIYSISSAERCYIYPGERKPIKTFIEIEIPENFFGLIIPRKESYIRYGISAFQDVLFPNDKKELQVIVTNVNIPKTPFNMSDNERFFGEKSKVDIYIGDKIANLILIPITAISFENI